MGRHLVIASTQKATEMIQLLSILQRDATQDVHSIVDVTQILVNAQNKFGLELGTYCGVNLDFDYHCHDSAFVRITREAIQDLSELQCVIVV